ncbi:MAG: YitT family protein [Clostridia bacterium]|nr:YitT family protein [Clostridia bacterium]
MKLVLFPSARTEWIKFIKNTALVVLGTFVLAFGTGLFIIPFNLVTGGVSGIGIIINRIVAYFAGRELISVDFYISLINWLLFALGWIFLGRSFALKTLTSALVYPVALSLAVSLAGSDFLGGFFNLLSDRYAGYGELTVILATVFGGAAVGAGCALTFLGGGSTGGTDIIAFIICRFFKSARSSVAIFICDAAIVLIGMLVLGDLVISLLGIVSVFICAIAVDKLFIGESRAFIAHVVSEHYEEINERIIHRLNRTSTVVDCTGGYSGESKKMLISTFSVDEYAEFTAIIAEVDKRAFITVHRAHEINGEGWSYDSPTENEVSEE